MNTDGLRQRIQDFLGVGKHEHSPEYSILSEEVCDGYTRQGIRYTGSEGEPIPAYLLVPDGEGPFPALVAHHQHNGERHLGKSEICGLVGDPLQAFGPALVKRGLLVLAPDSICFEERRRKASGTVPGENDYARHLNEMCYRIVQGTTLMKKVLDDAAAGIALLSHFENVDSRRVGAFGHSYGGNTVLFQSALDERIAFACSSGAACTYKTKMAEGTGIEFAETIPGFAEKFDIDDLVKCIAPRPLLLVSAEQDKFTRDAEKIVARSRETYDHLGVGDRLEHKRYPGGHPLTREMFTDIVEWLTLASGQIDKGS